MKRSKKHIDIVYRFLDQDLSPEELANFSEELVCNTELKEELEFQKEISTLINNPELIKFDENLIKAEEKYERSRKPRHKILLYSAAAVFVLAFTSIYILNSPNSQEKTNKHFTEYHEFTSSVSYHRGNNVEDIPNLGFDAYESKNFNEAILHFRNALEIDTNNVTIRFFLALAFFESGDYKNAIFEFLYILDSKSAIYSDQAEWELALCYLEIGEKAKAKILLNKIIDNKQFKNKEAKNIIRLLTE